MFLILTVCAGYLIYKYLVWHFDYWKIRGVPSAKAWPLFGTYIQSSLQRVNFIEEIDDVYKKFRSTSSFIGVFSGRKPQLMVLDSTVIKDILITKFKNFRDNEFGAMVDKVTDPLFGRNPFMLCGHEWKDKRAEITPAFSNQKIKVMHPVVEDTCRKMTQYIKKKIEENSSDGLDVKQITERYTADVVSSCIYGIDSKAFSEEDSMIHKMGANLIAPTGLFMAYFIATAVLPFIKWFYKMPLITKKSSNFFIQLTNDAVAMRTKSNLHRDDFLNYLLELKKRKNINEIDLTAHTVTFFLDGFETSSVVIAYALYYLGRNKEIQNKIRREILLCVQKHGKVTFEKITEMEYLDHVFNETLRIKPPIGYMSKLCTEKTELTDQKEKTVLIEKGMVIGIPVYSIHNDPEYYTNPSEFNPDRFSEENGGLKGLKDKGIWLSFGQGSKDMYCKTSNPLKIDPKRFVLSTSEPIYLNIEKIEN